ncbi:MAG TPA: DNA adenine methylase [Arcobacter sp.]|nr:DNA adenine methylase [Arcobacter sp.]
MRFIGNKDLIITDIWDLLNQKGLINKDLTFFDAFCGTGAVSDALKDSFNIISNDMLTWSVTYTKGRVNGNNCNFNTLGFNPIDFFNLTNSKIEGFFFQNYSPGNSKRMYFSSENAGRIDYFRVTIEEWKKKGLLTENEYAFLLASLIESISFVANTAGVYGAFLKHWDPRALKAIIFRGVSFKEEKKYDSKVLNDKLENIISDVKCDVLYLDPPYTQNQYGTQYHLLETLILYDNPKISPITGSRSTTSMRSDWSKEYKTHILFDEIISKTKAKYILFSYSQDGLMSKSFIEASLKRYGKIETYVCKKISYKKYKNFKSKGKKDHFEYLFFVEKKDLVDIKYESPLNYIGSKAKMISEIKENLPLDYNSFIDAFGGGSNVAINIKADKVVYNDINHFVKNLVESFQKHDTYQYISYIKRIIKKYGLEKADTESYKKVRSFYNSLAIEKRDPRLLYTIILYGYNQQIRFNGNYDFNNPVGMRWFNDKVLEKLISFSRVLKEHNIIFENKEYTELDVEMDSNTFFYMDPPYRLTTGSYNDGKRGFAGWNESTEKELFEFADKLHHNGKYFMISYIMQHKGIKNDALKSWIEEREYRVIDIKERQGINRQEVLIVNYD